MKYSVLVVVQQLDKDLENSVRELEVEREKATASIGEQVRILYTAAHNTLFKCMLVSDLCDGACNSRPDADGAHHTLFS